MTIATGAPRRKGERKKRAEKTVVCQVCLERLPRITGDHVRTHGMTLRAYISAYTPSLAPSALAHLSRRPGTARPAALLDPDFARTLAERTASDPDFIFRLADEVSDVLATGPIRDRIRVALGAVIDARVEMQSRALAMLSRAYDELKEPWRMRQAEAGGPVPTSRLLDVISTLATEVARGEDTIVRAGRLVLEEQRTRLSAGLSTVDAADRFKGVGADVPLPPADSTPEAREDMRIMWNQLMRAFGRAQERRTISAQATVVGTAPLLPPTSSPSVPAASAPPSAAYDL
jgi:hypothetical protein